MSLKDKEELHNKWEAPTSSSEKQTFNDELSLMVKNFNKFYKNRSKEGEAPSQDPTMTVDLLVVIVIATIVEDPETIPMNVLQSQVYKFKMKDGEGVTEMYSRLALITN